MLIFNLRKLERNCKELAYTCHGQYVFHIVTVTSVLSWVMKFTLTGFNVQSLYYPQITRIATIKITAVFIHCDVSFFVRWLCVIIAFVGRTKVFLYGTSCCDGDTQGDNNCQTQLSSFYILYSFNATCHLNKKPSSGK
jgi:hypothetical protein